MSLLLLLGTPSAGVAPVVNYFARFNGTTDYATIPNYTVPSQAGTILVRVRLDSATSANSGLVELGAVESSTHYPYSNGLAYVANFRNESGGRVDGISLSGYVDRTDWHWFIVRTNVADGWEFLQGKDNGTLYSISTQAHSIFTLTQVGGFIGRNVGGEKLDGDIDRMLLFSTRLSDADIQAVIAGGNGTSPLLRYEFSSDAGGVFADESGNARDATITGTPTIIAE